MQIRSIFQSIAIFIFLGLAACIGPSFDTHADELEESDPAEAEETTVLSMLADIPQFSIFTEALIDTGLGEVLEGTGPFTVLAPTDDAFEILNLDLSTLTPDQMANLLKYHIIAGEMSGNAAKNTSWSNTLQQERIHLQYTLGDVVVDGLVTITDFDLQSDNGLIHVLDGALLPASMYDRIDLIQIVRSYPRLSKFRELMEGAGELALDLGTQNANLTLFAPPNDAFNAVNIDPADLNANDLTSLANLHVVGEVLDSAALEELSEVTTLSGEILPLSTDGDLVVNENSTIVYADIEVNNGILHILDRPISKTSEE